MKISKLLILSFLFISVFGCKENFCISLESFPSENSYLLLETSFEFRSKESDILTSSTFIDSVYIVNKNEAKVFANDWNKAQTHIFNSLRIYCNYSD